MSPSLQDLAAGQQGMSEGSSVSTIVRGTLEATRQWLRKMFEKPMLQVSVLSGTMFTYREEIEVSFSESQEQLECLRCWDLS